MDHETNNVILAGSRGDDFELKVMHNNPAEVENLEGYYYKKDGGHKEDITENQFMNELRTVLMMAETKAMQLHDPKTFAEL